MADIDSVLAENEHQELVTISPIEEVVNNSAAIEEVVDNSATEEVVDLSATEEVVDNSATEEVVKNAAAIEEADIPNEVRAEDDSKQEPRVVDFKAAVLQPPVKSTRVFILCQFIILNPSRTIAMAHIHQVQAHERTSSRYWHRTSRRLLMKATNNSNFETSILSMCRTTEVTTTKPMIPSSFVSSPRRTSRSARQT